LVNNYYLSFKTLVSFETAKKIEKLIQKSVELKSVKKDPEGIMGKNIDTK
tara:strand:- start:185 stop:334 length:150 start_codon:yes stop_codon:yes gene_type:complete